jgi:hypothetical protein
MVIEDISPQCGMTHTSIHGINHFYRVSLIVIIHSSMNSSSRSTNRQRQAEVNRERSHESLVLVVGQETSRRHIPSRDHDLE